MAVALLTAAVGTVQGANVTVYSGDAAFGAWSAAAGAPLAFEDFADTTLVAGLAITFGSGDGSRPGSISGGLYQDRANDSQATKPVFTFTPPITAFGGNWFLDNVPPGTTVSPGIKLHLTFADGTTSDEATTPEIPFTFTGQFFGIVTDTPIRSIRFDEGEDNPDQQPTLVETFNLDDARFGPMPTITAVASGFSLPFGVAVSSGGDVFIADRNRHVVWKVAATQLIPVAGVDGQAGYEGDGVAAVEALLSSPSALAVGAGKLYIADTGNHIVREVDLLASTPLIRTVAGIPNKNGPGVNGVLATESTLFGPRGVAVDGAGNVYVSDTMNQQIRKLTPGAVPGTFTISAVAGTPGSTGAANGPVSSASFNSPQGIAVDAAGNVYVADEGNHQVRKVSGGVVTTVAGTGEAGFSGDGGPATAARLDSPSAVALGTAGSLYVADVDNRRVRLVSGGVIGTVAGAGVAGSAVPPGGLASATPLNAPVGVATDSIGNLYITDLPEVNVSIVVVEGEEEVITVEAAPAVLGRLLVVDFTPAPPID